MKALINSYISLYSLPLAFHKHLLLLTLAALQEKLLPNLPQRLQIVHRRHDESLLPLHRQVVHATVIGIPFSLFFEVNGFESEVEGGSDAGRRTTRREKKDKSVARQFRELRP